MNKPYKQILLVDDETMICGALQEYLILCGYQVMVTYNAEEALAIMEKHAIDVVITDINLPEMDGLELTEIVRQKFETDVIVITGFTNDYSYEEAVSKGASDFIFKPFRMEELKLRLKRVLHDRDNLKDKLRLMEELRVLSITDALTGLYNSRYFYKQLKSETQRSQRYQHPLSLLLMDVDHFKAFNDCYGHVEGDKVLMGFGKVISDCLRSMDSAYRYGGEEFTILLPETSSDEACQVAQRINTKIGNQIFTPQPDKDIHITASIGVAQYQSPEKNSIFIKRADTAMYQSKDNGRNLVSFI